MKQLIVLSNPTPVADEAHLTERLFSEGLQLFHWRRKDAVKEDLYHFAEQISPQYHDRIVWPATFMQEISMPGRKFHFYEYLRVKTDHSVFDDLKTQGFKLSTSIHDTAAYKTLPAVFDYTFFSPVFDSISKPGYMANIKEQSVLLRQERTCRIIALGGVNENNCRLALDSGFDGIALLGAIWQSHDPLTTFKKIQTCITTDR